MPPLSLDGSDRVAPPSLDRSDCSSISAGGDFNAFTPRPEGHFYRELEKRYATDGDITPRLPAGLGVLPQFSLQPYLKSYVLHSQVKAHALAGSAHGGRIMPTPSGTRRPKRPISAPVTGSAASRHVVIINGMRYVPAGMVEANADIIEPWARPGSAGKKLQLSRTFTDFSSPMKGLKSVGRLKTGNNRVTTRPWTAQAGARSWTPSAHSHGQGAGTNGKPTDPTPPVALGDSSADASSASWPTEGIRSAEGIRPADGHDQPPGRYAALQEHKVFSDDEGSRTDEWASSALLDLQPPEGGVTGLELQVEPEAETQHGRPCGPHSGHPDIPSGTGEHHQGFRNSVATAASTRDTSRRRHAAGACLCGASEHKLGVAGMHVAGHSSSSMRRPSSAGFVERSNGAGVHRGAGSSAPRRPASANHVLIGFQMNRVPARGGGLAGYGAGAGVGYGVDALRCSAGQMGAGQEAGGRAAHTSTPTSTCTSTLRPSSALARRKVKEETEKLTQYSQDALHPERLSVTYVTRTKQSEDNQIRIDYQDQDVALRLRHRDRADTQNIEQGSEGHALRDTLSQPLVHARGAHAHTKGTHKGTQRSWATHMRPASASSRYISDRVERAEGEAQERSGCNAVSRISPRSRCRAPPTQPLPPPGSGPEYAQVESDDGETRQARGWGRTRSTGEEAEVGGREGPYAGAGKRYGGAGKRGADMWAHRMERIWETRFGRSELGTCDSMSPASSGSSARRHHAGRDAAADDGRSHQRARPQSASGVLMRGGGSGGDMMELQRQMQVLADIQRDLQVRTGPAASGVASGDEWKRKAVALARPAGTGSSTCAVQ